MTDEASATTREAPPRLLVVAHFTEPFAGTGSRRPTRLARFMAAHGVPPALVTASPEFYGQAIRPGSCIRDELEVHEVERTGAHRLLGHLGRWPLNAALMRAYRRTIGHALERGPRPDFLYICGNPFWLFPLGRYFRKRAGLPYVLDFPDVFYSGGVRYRLGDRSGLRRFVDKAAEARAVAEAALIVHTSEAQTALYRRRYPAMPAERFATVRWGYDADAVRAVVPQERPDDDVFRVGIFGKFASYGRADAEALAEAVGMFHARTRVLVTQVGDPEPALAEAFRMEGLSACFHAAGRMRYAEGMGLLASMDALALNAISDLSLPAKVYDYVYLNRPVVALVAPDSAAAGLMSEFPGAFMAQTAEGLRRAFERIRTDRVRELEPGLNPTEFSQQEQFETLLSALREAQVHG